MTLSAGTRLGPYEIQSALGAGGMGEVYRARDSRLGRDVAIKVLPSDFSSDPERLRRFEQEARAAAALNHPNILAVYDISQHDRSPFIVAELLEGETLRERLNSGAFPVRKAVEYAVQVAHGLAAAHEKGIVHRDLKPENIFVTSDGHVKILDFGLAKLTQAESSPGGASALPTTPPHTTPGLVLGTIGYMSPEQVRGVRADHRSDIFSFGAILYEMLSGQRAFHRETGAETMTAILKEDPSDLPVERHIPPELKRIVERCLEKRSEARFQSTRDLAFALEGLSSQSDSAVSAADLRIDPKSVASAFRLAWAVAAGALIVAVVAVAVMLRSGPVAAPEPVVTRLDVVTSPTVDPYSFALSPDGRQLAFVADGGYGTQLWLRSLDGVRAEPLVGTVGASYPFWAPDGRAIAFFSEGKLKRLDLGIGAPQVVADAPFGRGGTWNSAGVIVFAGSTNSGLLRVMATGGAVAQVTRLTSGQGSHRWPQFLPDGQQFIYSATLGQLQTRGVYVAALDGAEPARLLAGDVSAEYAPPGYLLWVSQGALVAQSFDPARAALTGDLISVAQGIGFDEGIVRSAFSSTAGVLAHRSSTVVRRQLVWVDRSGKQLRTIGPPEEGTLAHPALAPDGRRIAASRIGQGNADLWLTDASSGVSSRLTFDTALDTSPIWSPDGSRVVFRTGRNGPFDLFEKPSDGATDEQSLLVTPQDKFPLDWSRDARILLYSIQHAKTGSDLWALPMTGERKPFAVVQTSFDDIEGQLSPDGRWLAYASNESGRFEIYVRSFPGSGGRWQVSMAGGLQPRWRHDGGELFYIAPDTRLMAVSIRVPSGTAGALEPAAPVPLFQTRLARGSNISATGALARAQYAVASDGRFLMNVAVDDAVTSPITIVLNWEAALAKK